MDYESLFEQAEKLEPTLFAMEPCCGYSQISLRLQNMGHEVKVISGHAVKNWIATHKSNQKTDLNDATALAKLALYDHDLQPIRVKNVEECRIASVQAIRIQLRTQATKSLVCFKSLCQCWGIVIRRGSSNTKKMAEAVAAVEKLLGAEVASSLMILRDAYKFTMKQINALDKLLDALVEANEQARTMKTVLASELRLRHALRSQRATLNGSRCQGATWPILAWLPETSLPDIPERQAPASAAL